MNQQVVVVTGAAHGIGRGIAEAYSAQGAQIVLVDQNKEQGELVAEQLIGSFFIQTDVRKPKDIAKAFQQIEEKYGRIDVLINNAGVSKFKDFFDMTIDDWDDILQTNLRSVFICSQEAAKRMKSQESGGSIVNMASTRAFQSEPNTEAYAASKGGIFALTHALAATLSSHNIRVNSIAPGWIEVNDYEGLREIDHTQHWAGRVGKPSDIAKACLYFTDPQNDFVTGVNLRVDGGMTHQMIYEH